MSQLSGKSNFYLNTIGKNLNALLCHFIIPINYTFVNKIVLNFPYEGFYHANIYFPASRRILIQRSPVG